MGLGLVVKLQQSVALSPGNVPWRLSGTLKLVTSSSSQNDSCWSRSTSTLLSVAGKRTGHQSSIPEYLPCFLPQSLTPWGARTRSTQSCTSCMLCGTPLHSTDPSWKWLLTAENLPGGLNTKVCNSWSSPCVTSSHLPPCRSPALTPGQSRCCLLAHFYGRVVSEDAVKKQMTTSCALCESNVIAWFEATLLVI